MRIVQRSLLCLFVALLCACGGAGDASLIDAPKVAFSTVHAFATTSASGPYDGRAPRAPLVPAANGKLYGTTQLGGAQGAGMVFAFDPVTGHVQSIHDFSAMASDFTNADGAQPRSAVALGPDGRLYGTTSLGGAHGDGTVYRLDPATRAFETLHAFDNGANGLGGASALTLAEDGTFYGATVDGGDAPDCDPHGCGTLIKVDPESGSVSIVHSFSRAEGNPWAAPVFGGDGKLYGSTQGGGAPSMGLLYRFDPATSDFEVLHEFTDGDDGSNPHAALVLHPDGGLYGVTSDGIVFRLDPASDEVEPLAQVPESEAALVVDSEGRLYGTTIVGGPNGTGTVFRIDRAAQQLTVLHFFGPFNDPGLGTNIDGATPEAALVIASPGVFYGVTTNGRLGDGSLFRMTVSEGLPP